MSEVATGPLRKAGDSSVLIVGVGAWQGLGAAIARRFAGGGHPVVIAGRNVQKLETTAAELKKTGARVSTSSAMRRCQKTLGASRPRRSGWRHSRWRFTTPAATSRGRSSR